MGERKKTNLLIHTRKGRGFLMEERKRFRKQEGRGERRIASRVGLWIEFGELFCVFLFGRKHEWNE